MSATATNTESNPREILLEAGMTQGQISEFNRAYASLSADLWSVAADVALLEQRLLGAPSKDLDGLGDQLETRKRSLSTLIKRAKAQLATGRSAAEDEAIERWPAAIEEASAAADKARTQLVAAGRELRAAMQTLRGALGAYRETCAACSDAVRHIRSRNGQPLGLQISVRSNHEIESLIRDWASGDTEEEALEERVSALLARLVESHSPRK